MKAFLAGMVIACSIAIIGLLANDRTIITLLSGSIGLVSFLVSGLYIGIFVSSDQIRIQYKDETKEERRRRLRKATTFILLGIPNLILTIYMNIV